MSRVAFNPSDLTISLDPFKKDMIVLFPTPVSPIIMTAYLLTLSMGMASTPVWMSVFRRSRSIGFESLSIFRVEIKVF